MTGNPSRTRKRRDRNSQITLFRITHSNPTSVNEKLANTRMFIAHLYTIQGPPFRIRLRTQSKVWASGFFTETITLIVVEILDTRVTPDGLLILCMEGIFTMSCRTVSETEAANVWFNVPRRRELPKYLDLLRNQWYVHGRAAPRWYNHLN